MRDLMRRRWFAIVASGCLVAGLRPAAQGNSLQVRFLDVGQADAAIVTCPDGAHHLVIDSGDTRYPGSSKAFRDAMLATFPQGQRSLDLVVASHPHQDHIGNMEWLLKTFTVGTYVDNGAKGDTASFGRLDVLRRKLVSQHKLKYVNGKTSSGDELTLCQDVTLHLLEPWASDSKLTDTNDRSVAVRLDYKQTSFLFVGDIEGPAEDSFLNKSPKAERDLLDVDVLKVGHHGSDTSSTAAFLAAITPTVAVISSGEKDVGTNNRYKHPRLSSLRRLDDLFKSNPENGQVDAYDKPHEKWVREDRRQGIWLTTADGEVIASSDGSTVVVSTKPH